MELSISADRLRTFSSELLQAAGVPSHHAELVADALVSANLRGVDSHGVQLLGLYIEGILLGNVDPLGSGHLASQNGACAVYHGGNAIGHVVSLHCCDHALRIARDHGVGFVTARESNHFGAAAYWAQRIAAGGMIGIVMCNATPLVAPWQGREPRLGTNPICMALPGPAVWLLDMATTTVALNRIWKAAADGEMSIPPGWAMDKNGSPTTSVAEVLDGGLPMPLGGYKGTGLAMMVEILCAVLSGGAMSTELGGLRMRNKAMRVSQCFVAIDVSRFMTVSEFSHRMHRLGVTIKSTAPAAGFNEVLLAGEPEWRSEASRSETGIPITVPIWNSLLELANRLNVRPPVL
jgi:LDH2 family malate/lactate/ureidoglycolate dehydrogenase